MQAEQNYIYILFAALYIIYSIVKAVKKNSQPPPVPQKKPGQPAPTVQPPVSSPAPNPGDEMKKMLEELLGGSPEVDVPEKQVVKPRVQPVSSRPAPAKIAPHHPKKEKLTTQPIKPLASKQAVTAERTHFVSHPELTQKAFAETQITEEETPVDFDIRQAVIYSEILKRPQY